ncbi:hypothetical protein [Cyanobium sp. PCC 7001]|uniref:hypothetical protein n=1 Tax=Cyanobium sp. PCC 7001 TaxID=180281 RepID=UPI0005BCDB2E|nr:hypothetical protein [Cyanobium sp. PCC 7001]
MDSRAPARQPSPARRRPQAGGRLSHRGYGLVIKPAEEGWEARIEDPAGHVADVVLQEQLAVDPFPSAALAQEAAEQFVDELLGQESSY